MMSENAPAKLNLALHVRARQPDGYHELETLFAFADTGDTLAAAPAETLTLAIDGPMAAGLSAGEDNLVIRAARLLAAVAGRQAQAALRLTKRLPVASGIGGGSADAAAALRLLNRFWGLDWPRDRLAALAASLGADVPACVHSVPLVGTGRGEALTPVALPHLDGAPVLLVNPLEAVPTGPVFAAWDGIDHGPLDGDFSVDALNRARNDLQPGAIRLCPAIGQVLDRLGASPGARLVRMSGSGATCFAIFGDGESRDQAAAAIGHAHPGWWLLAVTLG